MKKKRFTSAIIIAQIIIVFLVASLVACQTAPTKQLEEAREAQEAAEKEEAPKFAAALFASGQTALKAAEDEIESRHYAKAREYLTQAIKEFHDALSESSRALVFTGTVLTENEPPVSPVVLTWGEAEVKDSHIKLVMEATFSEDGYKINIVSTETNLEGKFTLRIHPKHCPECLDTQKRYTIFTKRFVTKSKPGRLEGFMTKGVLQANDMPLLFQLKEGELSEIMKHGIRNDLGIVNIKENEEVRMGTL